MTVCVEQVTDTAQRAAISTTSCGAGILIEEGNRTEESPCLAKPRAVRSCSLSTVETKEALTMVQVHFTALEKHKKILARSSLGYL